jgi:hypothetical protein
LEEIVKRLAAALSLAAILAAVAVSPAAAITGNFVQDNVHTFVGLVAFYDANGTFVHRCTGELLAPTVVLTAGHCPDDATGTGHLNASARIWFQQDAGVNYNPVTQHDPVTGYPDSCTGTGGDQLGVLCATSHLMYNFGFNAFAGFPDIHDVGLVILDQPITGLGFASLAPAGTLDALARQKGLADKTFTVSGYGISSSAHKGTVVTSFRERLMGTESLVNTVSHWNAGVTIQLNGNGDDRAGTCGGDSGGPVFYPADSNQVVAVTSYGKTIDCTGTGFYYRTDRQVVIDWILAHAGADAHLIDVG